VKIPVPDAGEGNKVVVLGCWEQKSQHFLCINQAINLQEGKAGSAISQRKKEKKTNVIGNFKRFIFK
jgi:hypothetical protein